MSSGHEAESWPQSFSGAKASGLAIQLGSAYNKPINQSINSLHVIKDETYDEFLESPRAAFPDRDRFTFGSFSEGARLFVFEHATTCESRSCGDFYQGR